MATAVPTTLANIAARALLSRTLLIGDHFVAEAGSLAKEYLNRRSILQRAEINATPRHVSVVKKMSDTYAPLLLCVRQHKGVVEIYWCTINHGRYRIGATSSPRFCGYLARGKRKDLAYSMPRLLKHAKTWEHDLVIEIETRAAEFRRYLAAWSATKKTIRALCKITGPETSLGDDGENVPNFHAPLEEEVCAPGVMPTPPRLRQPPTL